MMKTLEKVLNSVKDAGKHIKKNAIIYGALGVAGLSSVGNAGELAISNLSYNGVKGNTMYIQNIKGGEDGYGTGNGIYLESPNPLQICSLVSDSPTEGKLNIDARSSNHTTNPNDPNSLINIELKNTGFPGTADNYLKFTMVDPNNFTWKNLIFNINNQNHDVKQIIADGGVNGSGMPYGILSLEVLEGTQTGVYNTGTLKSFNHVDLNRDGFVDLQDFAIFSKNWLKTNTLPKNADNLDSYADINRNNIVDAEDLALFLNEWLWEAE